MLENITSVTVKGGCFNEETLLTGILRKRLNIVFGRNGSGKSSISRCFASLIPSDDPAQQPSDFTIDLDSQNPERIKEHVYVFNEDFINKNVSLQSDGLGTIVTIGKENIELAKSISDAKTRLEELRNALSVRESQQQSHDKSKTKLEKQLKDALKNSDYASNAQILLNVQGKARVTYPLDDIYADGIQLQTSESGSLDARLKDGINKLYAIEGGPMTFWSSPQLPSENLAADVNKMLLTILPKPKLDENDQRVVDVASSPMLSHYIDRTKEICESSDVEYCPLCHQPLAADYKQHLLEVIALVRDETSNRFINSLEGLKISCNSISTDNIDVLSEPYFDETRDKYLAAVGQMNATLRKIQEAISDKENRLYEQCQPVDETRFRAEWQKCHEAIIRLESRIKERNDAQVQKASLIRELEKLNRQKAYNDNRNEFDAWHAEKECKEQTFKEIGDIETSINSEATELQKLQAKGSNVSFAMDYINQCLAYVFYDKERLRLTTDDGTMYRLNVRGQSVSPDRVSTGERNVIALSYFFATMFRGTNSNGFLRDEKLVVIDDPVSSFDYNNRMGIFSLLNKHIAMLLSGRDTTSKILILTHDISIVDFLRSMYDNLRNGDLYHIKKNEQGENCYLELVNHNLTSHDSVKPNTYKQLLNEVFTFASGEENSDYNAENGIGNVIRRFVEKYMTLRYDGCDINRLFDDYHIKDQLPKELQTYFREQGIKNVLNSVSHDMLDDDVIMYDTVFGNDELRRLARNLLAFMYRTDKVHLKYSIDDNKDARKQKMELIRKFYDDIRNIAYRSSDSVDTSKIQEYKGSIRQAQFDGKDWHCDDCGIARRPEVDLENGMEICLDKVVPNGRSDIKYTYFAPSWHLHNNDNKYSFATDKDFTDSAWIKKYS